MFEHIISQSCRGTVCGIDLHVSSCRSLTNTVDAGLTAMRRIMAGRDSDATIE